MDNVIGLLFLILVGIIDIVRILQRIEKKLN